MGTIGIILAIIGCVCYHYDIWWLFYICGAIVTLADIYSILDGELRCFGTLATMVCWRVGYDVTGSIIDGILLGSCASTVVLVVAMFVFLAVTGGIGAAMAMMGSFWGNKENDYPHFSDK